MQILTLDFETFWDTDYSLTKFSPLEYVTDSRFETISCSFKPGIGKSIVAFGSDVGRYLENVNWKDTAVLAHNTTGFDAYVLAYRYNVRPKLWLDTMAMARPIHAKTTGLGLGKLVAHYALGVKDNTVLLQTKGRRLKDFTRQELLDMEKYNSEDTDQCRALFDVLMPHYTVAELWQIDAIVRMRTEPKFKLNMDLLYNTLVRVRAEKREALLELAERLEIEGEDDAVVTEEVRKRLASAPKFAALLTDLGVDVPMKVSPTSPDKIVPALAKTDEGFIALQSHPNSLISLAAMTRLQVKSTLLETRLEAFCRAGERANGLLPIPLRYCGADTTGRDSGEDYNPQNMPRVVEGHPKLTDALRASLGVPEGYLVFAADQSGIELRVNHFLWQVKSSMELFRASPDKADLYRAFAGQYLFNIDPADVAKPQRQIGKIAQLGLGFGAGALTFQRIARLAGADIPLEREGDDLSCTEIVQIWRDAYKEIYDGWGTCNRALEWIAHGHEFPVDRWKLVTTCSEGFVLPSGRKIRYPALRRLDEAGVIREFFHGERPEDESLVHRRVGWWYGYGRHLARLTGPKADENIVQALARDSIFDCALEFYRQTGLRPSLRVHDELVYVAPAALVPKLLAKLQTILRTPPKWWPELIVWSEGGSGATYADTK